MGDSLSGWIKLHRTIRENWLYKEKRVYSRFEAWIDLLLEANHKDNRFPLGNEIVECKRGQLITSIRQLCDRWNWSNTKVNNFLKLLQDDGMIAYFSDTKKTVITIENYNIYQDKNDTETLQEHHESDTLTSREHTNKNDKNVKNDKKYIIYAEFVKMTEEEYNKLVEKHGEELTNKMIEVLDNYKGSKGKKYKSDYRAILSWVADKVLKENGGSNGNSKGNGGEDTWDIEHLITRG